MVIRASRHRVRETESLTPMPIEIAPVIIARVLSSFLACPMRQYNLTSLAVHQYDALFLCHSKLLLMQALVLPRLSNFG